MVIINNKIKKLFCINIIFNKFFVNIEFIFEFLKELQTYFFQLTVFNSSRSRGEEK